MQAEIDRLRARIAELEARISSGVRVVARRHEDGWIGILQNPTALAPNALLIIDDQWNEEIMGDATWPNP